MGYNTHNYLINLALSKGITRLTYQVYLRTYKAASTT